ncbi:MAG: U32 family peptidase [Proteobacteria bacterium]|nr:U32 family peptidase [Pseudomonadota bacterium]MBU4468903.1 U32 family peptidase [Pseudomonadota bacterium]MCG2750896.1 U32 family peptidase [Desulfobacteraceae bacterium]
MENKQKPAILAPAGNKEAFMAAVAAGADAVYCGLKQFSARKEAKNFALEELNRLTRFAHEKGVGVYIAINALLKTGEIQKAALLVAQLEKYVKPDALIIQDLSLVQIARSAGFSGEIHLSTLANVSFPSALKMADQKMGIHRVVVPRELNIDEIKMMAASCSPNLQLEVFVHGALCYGVSGRCYWSSFLGGKSGLKGECVQPCRRQYAQKDQSAKFFSCRDLSLDVLVKVLLNIKEIAAWKIEGRKKGPHYVYYTTQAYKLLRDEAGDPQTKKTAVQLLERALGRPGTHFFFLPQRPYNPVEIQGQTGSGLLIGKITGEQNAVLLKPLEALLPGDLLRIGYESEPWHQVIKVRQSVPKRGRLVIKIEKNKKPLFGTPVFLIDRREKELQKFLTEAETIVGVPAGNDVPEIPIHLPSPGVYRKNLPSTEFQVHRTVPSRKPGKIQGVWLSPEAGKRLDKLNHDTWLWLPPVIWPEEEKEGLEQVRALIKKGFKRFVLNMPWQMAWFDQAENLSLWAGPFCNICNPWAVDAMKKLGFHGVILSPELSAKEYLDFPKNSSLPLGLVISGNWPFCISRIESPELKPQALFKSPKNEEAWSTRYDGNTWVFPNWKLDIQGEKDRLEKAGYRVFVHLMEPIPPEVALKIRPGKWNWDLSSDGL